MSTGRMPPGPRGLDAYGFLGRGSAARAFEFLEKTARKYGPISSFQIFGQWICLVDDPELIKQVLVTDQHKFRRDTGATLLRELLGDGLLTMDEPQHLDRRRVLQPAFHRAQVAGYSGAMVTEAERMAQQWRPGTLLDIGAEMKRVTLSIVGAALFGMDFGKDAGRVADVLQRAIRRSAKLSLLLVMLEPWILAYRRWRPDGRSLFFARERKELEAVVGPILQQHRREGGTDLMSLLLSYARQESGTLRDEDVQNEIITMVLAGHETTATALTWACYLISRDERVEERLFSEIDAVLAGRTMELDDVQRLPYTGMVFNEALRLYPPALAFGRRPLEDIELDGHTIRRGVSVLVSPYITHRNPRFFDDPLAFRPERWENMTAPKFAFFPFGGGSKMCIGESFARLEGVAVLATLLQRWKLRYEGPEEIGINPGITLGPSRKIEMRASAR